MNTEGDYKETHETWNKVALLYQEKFMDLDIYNETYDRFCDLLLTKEARVLEIGCGPGNITNYLQRKRPDLKLVATDVSPEMVKLAAVNNPGARCEILDARNISSLREKFDAVIAGFCLPYLCPDDVIKLFDDSADLLTTGGIIYISALEGDHEKSSFESGSSGRVFVYYYNLETLEQLLSDAGFRVVYIKSVPFQRKGQIENHIILIAQK